MSFGLEHIMVGKPLHESHLQSCKSELLIKHHLHIEVGLLVLIKKDER